MKKQRKRERERDGESEVGRKRVREKERNFFSIFFGEERKSNFKGSRFVFVRGRKKRRGNYFLRFQGVIHFYTHQ